MSSDLNNLTVICRFKWVHLLSRFVEDSLGRGSSARPAHLQWLSLCRMGQAPRSPFDEHNPADARCDNACASLTNTKCSKRRIVLTVLQPKKGCNLSEVTWQVKDELGSKPRSVDPQAQASAKFFCSQRLKSCFLLRVAKPARTCILCARHTSQMLHTH